MRDWKNVAGGVIDSAMRAFGESVQATYAPAAGGSFLVDLVFTAEREVVTTGDSGVEISSLRPVAGIRLSDFAARPVKGDRITIEGLQYDILDFHVDSAAVGGQLILKLEV